MRFIKLGNTVFLASLVQGANKVKAPQDMNVSHPWRVTVFLDSESLKMVTYPLKTEDSANKLIEDLLEGSKVINLGDEVEVDKGPTKLNVNI